MADRPARSGRSSKRGADTLVGNGWLRESPCNVWPADVWNAPVGSAALKKCMFLPVPGHLRSMFPPAPSPSLVPPAPSTRPPPSNAEGTVVPFPVANHVRRRERDAMRDVREMPAYAPRTPKVAPTIPRSERAWWEDPVALGSLLVLVPPIGLAAVWSSKRYSNDARWVLTVMTGLTMLLVSAIVTAALLTR